ncbi:MAG: hypothetical protein ACRYFU_03895 [Janthinobacterium lividum]
MRAGPILGKLSDTVVLGLKRAATHLPLKRQAVLISSLLPARLWFRAALVISRAQGRLVQRMGGNGTLTAALIFDHWLRELSFCGQYPLPYRSHGLEVCLTPGPKLFCWTHLPLTEIPMRVYLERGGAPVAVVSDPGKIVGENEFQVFGWPDRMEALPADSHLLSRVKTTLRSGKSVVFLADHYFGGPMSEVPLRLAAMLRVPLVLQWAELTPDGSLEITYREAPFPCSQTEAEIAENLAFLKTARDRTLTTLGWGVIPS